MSWIFTARKGHVSLLLDALSIMCGHLLRLLHRLGLLSVNFFSSTHVEAGA